MERLVGETLAEQIGREAIIAPGDLVPMITQLLAGLAAVHHIGAVHRDLKPANVFLADRPGESAQTKLLDFGIAQLSTRDHTPITTVGSIVGTANYMSPEQIAGKRKLDARSDLWSVGVIMYEALSGRPPFWSAKRPALLYQITTAPHRPLGHVDPSIPSELAAIVDKALAKDAAGRYSSAVELGRALVDLPDSGVLQRNQPPPLPSPTLQRTAPAAPGARDLRVGRSGLPVIDLDATTEETMAFALMPNRIRRSSAAPPARPGVEAPAAPAPLNVPRLRPNKGR
jgi:serine/threonine-protein kinase